MTTAQFIERTYNTTATKARQCSSVFTDYNGTVYSYGYHYPLAFHINGLDFINESGYSTTTSKHIAWARSALDYDYTGVKLWREDAQVVSSSGTDDSKIKAILTALVRERSSLTDQMVKRQMNGRTDTAIYRSLESEHSRVRDAIAKVEAAINE